MRLLCAWMVVALLTTSFVVAPSRASSPLEVTGVAPGLMEIQPYRGVYYERGRGGTGMFLDISPRGDLFISFYASTEDGDPTYYLMQGMFHPSSEEVRSETGVIGLSEPALYQSSGGECIEGADCPYREPTRAAVNLPVRLVWTTPRHATLTIGSKTFDMRAAEFAFEDGGDLNGSVWAGAWGMGHPAAGASMNDGLAVIRLRRAPFEISDLIVADGASAGSVVPPSTAIPYLLECTGPQGAEGCYAFFQRMYSLDAGFGFNWRDSSRLAMLWYDPVSHTMGLEITKGVLLGTIGIHFDLYFTGLDEIVGHGIEIGTDRHGAITQNLVLMRLAPNHYREFFDDAP